MRRIGVIWFATMAFWALIAWWVGSWALFAWAVVFFTLGYAAVYGTSRLRGEERSHRCPGGVKMRR